MLLPLAKCVPDLVGIPGAIDDIQVWWAWLDDMTVSDYAWGALFAASIGGLVWVLFGDRIRATLGINHGIDAPDGWSVSVGIPGNFIWLGYEKVALFQQCRFVNISNVRKRIIDIEIWIPTDYPKNPRYIFRTEYHRETAYRKQVKEIVAERATADRLSAFISLPIELAPEQVIEGQIDFALSDEQVANIRHNPALLRTDCATVKVKERISGREISFRLGQKYDAHTGKITGPAGRRPNAKKSLLSRLGIARKTQQ
ncbi:MAG: hypothetical protein WD711_04640 [Dongiaceae bacterium]